MPSIHKPCGAGLLFSFCLTCTPEEFRSWRQKTLIGTSLTVVAPTGQYDPTRLINQGSNRWAFRPELGLSQRWGHWILDAYGGVWFFTTNPEYFSHNPSYPGTRTQSEAPVGAFEGHLSYDIKNNRRFRVSLDGNFWVGGRTSEWCGKPALPPKELARRRHVRRAHYETPVSKVQLQEWRLHPVWRELPERVRWLAVLLAGQTSCQYSAIIRPSCDFVIPAPGARPVWRTPADRDCDH
jgi:hypothetical protein